MLHLYFWNYSTTTKPIALKFGGNKECRSPRLNVQFLSENVCPSCFNWTFNFWCNISWWMTVVAFTHKRWSIVAKLWSPNPTKGHEKFWSIIDPWQQWRKDVIQPSMRLSGLTMLLLGIVNSSVSVFWLSSGFLHNILFVWPLFGHFLKPILPETPYPGQSTKGYGLWGSRLYPSGWHALSPTVMHHPWDGSSVEPVWPIRWHSSAFSWPQSHTAFNIYFRCRCLTGCQWFFLSFQPCAR